MRSMMYQPLIAAKATQAKGQNLASSASYSVRINKIGCIALLL
jgi:hypothetical protein